MIEIVPYQQRWPVLFLQVARTLQDLLGENVLDIHHIRSTAVPAMSARNVIDVQVSVGEFAPEIEAILLGNGFKQFFYTDHCPAGEVTM